MKLHPPFAISARLAPALQIGKAWLSFANGQFVLDLPDGSEHIVTGFAFPQMRIVGQSNADVLQGGFEAILSFLSACAESRKYALQRHGDAMKGENSDLFPAYVGEWAEEMSNEIELLACELSEKKGLIEFE